VEGKRKLKDKRRTHVTTSNNKLITKKEGMIVSSGGEKKGSELPMTDPVKIELGQDRRDWSLSATH